MGEIVEFPNRGTKNQRYNFPGQRISPNALVEQIQAFSQEIYMRMQQAAVSTAQFEFNEEAAIESLNSLLEAIGYVHSLLEHSNHLPLVAVPIRLPTLMSAIDAQKAVHQTIHAIDLVRLRRDRNVPNLYQQAWEQATQCVEGYPSAVVKYIDMLTELCRNIIARSLL